MRIIHGAPYARTNYVIWAMNELGLDYEVRPVNPFAGETRTEEYLAINPNGLIPTLEEDGFVLWETLAINYYLARNYGDGFLWSSDPKEEALIMQWSLFGVTCLDKPAVNHILHVQALPEEMRQASMVTEAKEGLAPHCKVLENHLSDKDYLVGNDFTIADLYVAAVLDYPYKSGFDFSNYPNLLSWLEKCLARPARMKMST